MIYTVKCYVANAGGYFAYDVEDKGQATHHAVAIMKDGVYRRVNSSGDFEVWPVYKVKVTGDALDSEYADRFVRT